MTIKKAIETTILLQNNIPIDDFLGLTANEMHHLLYEPFGEKSPVQFQKDIDDKTLYKIPLFRIAEAYLKIIEWDKQIKLTPLIPFALNSSKSRVIPALSTRLKSHHQ